MKHRYSNYLIVSLCLGLIVKAAIIESSSRSQTDSSIGSSLTYPSYLQGSHSLEPKSFLQQDSLSSIDSLDSSNAISSLPEISTIEYRKKVQTSPPSHSSLVSVDASEKSQVVNTFKQQWWKNINKADQEAYEAIKSKNPKRAATFTKLAQKRRNQFEAIEILADGLANGDAKNQQWLTQAFDYCDKQAKREDNASIRLMFEKLSQKWKSELLKK